MTVTGKDVIALGIPAVTVRAEMARIGLAEGVDETHPHGCIMEGDWDRDAPWRVRTD